MKELTESQLSSNIKKTIVKSIQNKEFSKLIDEFKKKSKTKDIFWTNIVNPKYNKIFEQIAKFIIQQKKMPKILSYLYSKKFLNELKIKNKNKKTNLVKEVFIMKIVADGTKGILKILKKQHQAIKRRPKKE